MILVFPRRRGLKFHFGDTQCLKKIGNLLTADAEEMHTQTQN